MPHTVRSRCGAFLVKLNPMRHIILISLLSLFVFSGTIQSQSLNFEPDISVSSDLIRIKWQTPAIEWLPDEAGFVTPTLSGYQLSKASGRLKLPFYSALVALPYSAEPTLEITAVSKSIETISSPIAISPRPEGVVYDAVGEIIGGGYVDVLSPSTEGSQAYVEIEEIGLMRGVRLARVTFYPIQPLSEGRVELVESLNVTLYFNAPQAAYLTTLASGDLLTDSVQQMVINPQHVQLQVSPEPSHTLATVQLTGQAVVIEVDEVGLTAVNHAELIGAGFSLSGVDPDKLHLSLNGVAIPFEWDGDGDTQFETNERLIFYANPEFSRWSNSDSYLLTVESSDGARVSSVASSTSGLSSGQRFATLLLEENQVYSPNCYCGSLPLGRNGDRWMWDDLRQPGRPENDYAFSLPLADNSKTAELTAWFMGFTSVYGSNPDHKVAVSINGTLLGSSTWDARTAVTETYSIPVATLQTSNELNLNLPGIAGVEIDGIWFDAASIRYVLNSNSVGNQIQFEGESSNHKYSTRLNNLVDVRVYDVTDPAMPVLHTNLSTAGQTVTFGESGSGSHRYVVSNSNGLLSPTSVRLKRTLLTSGASEADYVIVSHPDFIPSLTRLVNWRESQGLEVVVEDVFAIYDAYGNGRPSPDAIYDYLTDAYTNWTPTYVLLVGDATTDPKQYLVSSSGSWLLPFMADVDPWIGEVPSDNRYVSVDGNDIIPDMLVGRLPVNSPAETLIVVNKIVDYEENPIFGSWNGNVSLVADNRDAAGDFNEHSNEIIDLHIPAPYTHRSIYYKPGSNTTEEVINQIQLNWAAGNGLQFYNGHSSTHQWGAERFFHLDDVAGLTNGERLPIVLQMTCLTGSFHRSDFETLDEALLRHAGGGAVATWGATGLGVATGHEALAAGYLGSLLGGNPIVGAATLAGKLNVIANAPSNDELVETYTFLGDPAMIFNTDLWPGHLSYLPIVNKSP